MDRVQGFDYRVAALVTMVVVVFGYITTREIPAWILVCVTLLLPHSDKRLQANHLEFWGVWIVIALHIALAFINSHWVTLEGAQTDALSFHLYAGERGIDNMVPSIGYHLFLGFLVLMYEIFGVSLFFGNVLAVLMFSLSIILIYRLLVLAGVQRPLPYVLLFGLLPHVLVYTSITLREPWQLLFLVAMVYYGLKFKLDRDIQSLLILALSAICLGMLHQVLVVFSAAYLLMLFVWPIPASSLKSFLKVSLTASLCLLLIIGFIHQQGRQNKIVGYEVVTAVFSQSIPTLMQRLEDYRNDVNRTQPRTRFEAELDFSSYGSLLKTLPAHTFYYLFSPTPWQVDQVKDWILSLVGVLRLIAVIFLAAALIRGHVDRMGLFLIAVFTLMTFTWLFGTTNFGQASRHHVLTDWLLLVAIARCRTVQRGKLAT